ncbi:MAG: polysaccharide pyruvyl transferase family protein [Phycisphaeraceae bacterium]|nr:polysaccharide pyruvyl transferase family protein [Phycisphaeraceae bacterium]
MRFFSGIRAGGRQIGRLTRSRGDESLPSVRPSPIVLISAAGSGNYGDDLLLRYWLARYPTDAVTVVVIPGHESIPLGEARTLLITDAIQEPVRFGARLVAEGAQLVHLTGGGYCNDLFNSARPMARLLRFLARSTRVIATGVSFHPTGEKSLRALQSVPFDLLAVRDLYSLRAAGPRCLSTLLAGDDAGLIPPNQFLAASTDGERRLVVCWQDQFAGPTVPQEAARVITHLAAQLNPDRTIVLDLCPGDGAITEFLSPLRPIVVTRQDALQNGLPLRPSDTVITTRFHPRLLAERAGARTLGVALNDYYANKHELDGPAITFQGPAVRLPEFLSAGADKLLLSPTAPIPLAIDAAQARRNLESALDRVYSRTDFPRRVRAWFASASNSSGGRI